MYALERRGQLPEELQLSLKKQTLPDLLEKVSRQSPDHTALITPQKSYTFRDLQQQSAQIARCLQEKIKKQGVPVAIFAEPSWEFITALFGILKAGCQAFALDPLSQKCHISAILEITGAKWMLAGCEKVPGYLSDELNVLEINDIVSNDSSGIPAARISPQEVSHLIFKDHYKGIPLTHQGAVNQIYWYQTTHEFNSQDIAALTARPRCESVIAEIFNTLCNGVTVKILPSSLLQSPDELKQWIIEEKISLITLPTSTAEELLEDPWPEETPLRMLFTRGDRLKKPPPYPHPFKVICNYEKAECGGICMEYHVTHEEESLIIPMGGPIANIKPYVFDHCYQEVPHGSSGQLCLGGIGIAQGYLGEDEFNQDQFVIHTRVGKRPLRLFLTGDLVRKRNDGKLELLGKMEEQDSIGDFQVGLTAVESIINSHSGILHAVVQPVSVNDETALAAYWVAKNHATVSEGNLKRSLKRRLPSHMIPKYWIQLTKLPVDNDGKVCTDQLPIPQSHENRVDPADAPTNPIEMQLEQLWKAVLNVGGVGIRKSFFDLGGSSLAAARLLLKINQHFGKRLSSTDFFEHDTIEKMSKFIMESGAKSQQGKIAAIRKEGGQLPLICLHGFVGGPYFYYALSRHLDPDIPLYAIDTTFQQESLESVALQTIEKIREIHPKGPYRLLGQGIGAYLAFEAGKQLGQEVSFIGVVNTLAPHTPKGGSFLERFQLETRHFFKLNGKEKKQFLIQKCQAFEEKTGKIFGMTSTGDSVQHLIPDDLRIKEKKALASYSPEPCNCELTVYSTQEKSQNLGSDPSLGWKEITQKLKIEKIPGTQSTFVESPNIKTFAEKLNQVLIQPK